MTEVPLRHNLPPSTTRFFGRHKQATQIKERLCEWRLVTITGHGGVGKTSLALRVGHEVLSEFDSVQFVAVHSGASPDSIAGALQLAAEHSPATGVANAAAAIGERKVLIILDGCETAQLACGNFCNEILKSCPRAQFLAAGRTALSVEGEFTFNLEGMDVPPSDTGSLHELLEYDSARLFIEHYCVHPYTADLNSNDVRLIASICKLLKGFPFAIEVAAAHANSVGLQNMADFFREGLREDEVLGISEMLGEAIHWSCITLSERSRNCLSALTVFEGGFDIPAASAVCDLSPAEMKETLDELAEARLLTSGWSPGEEFRFEIPQAVVDYIRRTPGSTNDEQNARLKRHAEYFLRLAEQAKANLHGSEQSVWFRRCRSEIGNIVKAMTYFCAEPSERANATKLFVSIGDVWIRTGPMDIACDFAERVATSKSSRHSEVPLARAFNMAAAIFLTAGRIDRAEEILRRALEQSKAENDQLCEANALSNLAIVRMQTGNPSHALTLFKQASQLYQQIGDERMLATCLVNQGALLGEEGQHDQAFDNLNQALDIWQRLGNSWAEAWTRIVMGEIALDSHQIQRAAAEIVHSLREGLRLGDHRLIRLSLDVLAVAAEKQGQLDIAATFLGSGDLLADRHRVNRSKRFLEQLQRTRDSLRASLGTPKFESLTRGSNCLSSDDLLKMAEQILTKH